MCLFSIYTSRDLPILFSLSLSLSITVFPLSLLSLFLSHACTHYPFSSSQSRTHSLTHACTHSLTHPCTHTLTFSLAGSLSLTHGHMHSLSSIFIIWPLYHYPPSHLLCPSVNQVHRLVSARACADDQWGVSSHTDSYTRCTTWALARLANPGCLLDDDCSGVCRL